MNSRARQLVAWIIGWFLVLVQCSVPTGGSPSPIALDSHFSYIVLGGDHVAESVGRYLAAQDSNKTVLVLKGSHCNDVLEPSEPSRLWLEASYLFAESAHYLGYEFIDPFLRGTKPGIAFTNQTMQLIPAPQQLFAVDPNLKLLTDARPHRIIYNKASSTALGVEVSINFEPHYIFAKEELIVAGRCKEDYRLLSAAEIIPRSDLQELLHDVPLEVALKSPIISPIFALHANPLISGDIPTAPQPYCLLATELYIDTQRSREDGNDGSAIRQPNAKVNIIINEQPPNRWIGFIPSVLQQSVTSEDRATILTALMDTIGMSLQLGTSETFQKLGLSLERRRAPSVAAASCPPEDLPGGRQCLVNHTLSAAYNGHCDGERSEAALQETRHLTKTFHLKTARNLRVLPFGLTAPFLDCWWKRIFVPRNPVREYTTRIGILSHNQPPFDKVSVDTLLEKLKERLKVIASGRQYR